MPIPLVPALLGVAAAAVIVDEILSALQTPEEPITRRVFYSFHYDRDAWRTSQVRNIGTIKKSRAAFDNDWETVAKGRPKAIRRWIDGQMHGRSCVVVLVGQDVVVDGKVRPWIKYEIEQAMKQKKALLGIRIHNLKNRDRIQDCPGENPFDYIRMPNGKPLSKKVKLRESRALNSQVAYAYIAKNLAGWIEDAVTNKPRYS